MAEQQRHWVEIAAILTGLKEQKLKSGDNQRGGALINTSGFQLGLTLWEFQPSRKSVIHTDQLYKDWNPASSQLNPFLDEGDLPLPYYLPKANVCLLLYHITLNLKLFLQVFIHSYQAYEETWLHDQKSKGKIYDKKRPMEDTDFGKIKDKLLQ